jgi:hypothetical protein
MLWTCKNVTAQTFADFMMKYIKWPMETKMYFIESQLNQESLGKRSEEFTSFFIIEDDCEPGTEYPDKKQLVITPIIFNLTRDTSGRITDAQAHIVNDVFHTINNTIRII